MHKARLKQSREVLARKKRQTKESQYYEKDVCTAQE